MSLSEAIKHRPFSNGTEGEAWMAKWCRFCANDHDFHPDGAERAGCEIILSAMMPDFPCEDFPWPEAWLPEPNDGSFSLPSRLCCAAFEPCTKGCCDGDPGAADRAQRVAEVTAYWQQP